MPRASSIAGMSMPMGAAIMRAELREQVKDYTGQGKLNNHVQCGGEEGEREVELSVVKHPLVILRVTRRG